MPGAPPFFLLTGFVDGMVDVRRGSAAPVAGRAVSPGAKGDETLVVEVKHRMGRIKARDLEINNNISSYIYAI